MTHRMSNADGKLFKWLRSLTQLSDCKSVTYTDLKDKMEAETSRYVETKK